jgi:hypothetical protein
MAADAPKPSPAHTTWSSTWGEHLPSTAPKGLSPDAWRLLEAMARSPGSVSEQQVNEVVLAKRLKVTRVDLHQAQHLGYLRKGRGAYRVTSAGREALVQRRTIHRRTTARTARSRSQVQGGLTPAMEHFALHILAEIDGPVTPSDFLFVARLQPLGLPLPTEILELLAAKGHLRTLPPASPADEPRYERI